MKHGKPFLTKITFLLFYSTVPCLSAFGKTVLEPTASDLCSCCDCLKGGSGATLSFQKLNAEDEKAWIEDLLSIELPQGMQEEISKEKRVNVFYKYTQPIEGYTVTCRFIPFGKDVETGYLMAKFTKGHSSFIYTDTKRSNYHLESIRNWHEGDVYAFEYISPAASLVLNKSYPHSPLGYHTPFQFVDVDFDGRKEFVVNDYDRSQGGNRYVAYKIKKNSIERMPDVLPYSQLNNAMEFDYENKCIVIPIEDGAFYSAKLFFVKKKEEGHFLESVPNFHNEITTKMIHDYMNKANVFSLDEVREKEGDKVYIYQKSKKRLILLEK